MSREQPDRSRGLRQMRSMAASTDPRNSSPSPMRRPSYQTYASATSNSASGATTSLRGHTGRALVALRLATIMPKAGSTKDWLSGAPVLVSATRGPALPREWQRGRPGDLPPAQAFLPGSDQKSVFQYRSLHPPSCILSDTAVHGASYGVGRRACRCVCGDRSWRDSSHRGGISPSTELDTHDAPNRAAIEFDRTVSSSPASSSARLRPLPARRQSMRLQIRRSGTGPTASVARDNSCGHCQSGRSLLSKTTTRRTSCNQPRRLGRGIMPWSLRESNRALRVDTGATTHEPLRRRRNRRAVRTASSPLYRCSARLRPSERPTCAAGTPCSFATSSNSISMQRSLAASYASPDTKCEVRRPW